MFKDSNESDVCKGKMEFMKFWTVRRRLLTTLGAAFVLVGCGGGGGGGSAGSAPNAKTASDVSSHVLGYGQSIISTSFAAYGPKFQSHGVAFFDNALGLWVTLRLGGSKLEEFFWQDQGETTSAGSLTYDTVDVTQSQSGTMSVTLGRCAGLTGTFNQTLQTGGYNGNINYSIPNVSTVVSTFTLASDGKGNISGTATNAVALQSGYTQNEQVVTNLNGSMKMTTTDSNSCSSVFFFAADLSGSGKITGSDPGLPATVAWNQVGTGTVKYANGSTVGFTGWKL